MSGFDNIPEDKFKNFGKAIEKSTMYTIKELSELLKVSRNIIYGLINSGKLRAVNLSMGKNRANYRITKKDLNIFLESEPNIKWMPENNTK